MKIWQVVVLISYKLLFLRAGRVKSSPKCTGNVIISLDQTSFIHLKSGTLVNIFILLSLDKNALCFQCDPKLKNETVHGNCQTKSNTKSVTKFKLMRASVQANKNYNITDAGMSGILGNGVIVYVAHPAVTCEKSQSVLLFGNNETTIRASLKVFNNLFSIRFIQKNGLLSAMELTCCAYFDILVALSHETSIYKLRSKNISQGKSVEVKCFALINKTSGILWLKDYSAKMKKIVLSEIEQKFHVVYNLDNEIRVRQRNSIKYFFSRKENEGNGLSVSRTISKFKTRKQRRDIPQKHKRFAKIDDYDIEYDGKTNLDVINKGLFNHPQETMILQQSSSPELVRTVNVEEGLPKFKKNKPLDDVIRPAGSSVELRCATFGKPTPNITWTKNNTAINRRIGSVKYNKWSLKMDDVITDDSGVYKCSACNMYGCIDSSSKVIVIDRLRSPPIQSDRFPQNQTVLVNGTALFECKIVSDLEPFIYWVKYTRKNESIQHLEKIVTSNNSRSAKGFIELARNPDQPHLLRLSNISHTDEGWYTCVAGNSIGISVASAYLTVIDKLPKKEIQRIISGHPYIFTVVALFVVSLFVIGTLFIIYALRKLKHEKLLKQRIQTVHQWTKKVIIFKPSSPDDGSCDLQMPVVKIEKKRSTFQTISGNDLAQSYNEYEFPLDSDWEIPRSTLKIGSILGEGAFGRVVKAEATNLALPGTKKSNSSNLNYHINGMGRQSSTSSIVAVKMVKEEHTDTDMASLVREMEVMKIIGKHVNIINLLGCCSRSDGPLWVIVEYAPHGNLKDFLKKNRPLSVQLTTASFPRQSQYLEEKPFLTEKNLISYAFQIARGMEYLASRRCIHRDLAARNVLVSDDYVMKIADFGLARDLQETDYYRKNSNGRLPIKWMAPESLQDKFYDSKSDVWSYGILLWEIMSYGEQPYAQLMSAEDLYSYLLSGQRMEKPIRCSLNIYLLMRQCWHYDATARPAFNELVEYLEKIYQLTVSSPSEEYLELSIPVLETPSSSEEEFEPDTFAGTSPLRLHSIP